MVAESEKKIANISKPEQCSIPSLEVGGEVASSDTEKAIMLARFFFQDNALRKNLVVVIPYRKENGLLTNASSKVTTYEIL